MNCPNCQARCADTDLYCHRCEAELVRPSKSLAPSLSRLPLAFSPTNMPRSIVASIGALALGVGIEVIRRGLLAKFASSSVPAVAASLPALAGAKELLLPQKEKWPHKRFKKGYAVEETVVYTRRIMSR